MFDHQLQEITVTMQILCWLSEVIDEVVSQSVLEINVITFIMDQDESEESRREF